MLTHLLQQYFSKSYLEIQIREYYTQISGYDIDRNIEGEIDFGKKKLFNSFFLIFVLLAQPSRISVHHRCRHRLSVSPSIIGSHILV